MTYKMLKIAFAPLCKWFPGQLPGGILRDADEVNESAELQELVAQERLQEPLCKGKCFLKVFYKTMWILMKPFCKVLPPFGR